MIDIIGYDGDYKITSSGKIISYKGKVPRELKLTINSFGYYEVCLSKNNKKKSYRVNRLVAIHYIPNPNNKPCVNHINCDKLNNDVSNLEWCTISENTKHAFDNNLCVTGESHHLSKLTIDDVKFIKSSDLSQRKLAKMFNVGKTSISNIRRGLSWSYV